MPVEKRTATYCLACALLVLASGLTFAAPQSGDAAKSAPPKPGAAEMERLKFYLGEWDYTETYPRSASPNGAKNTGVYTSKLGPGGNSLINTFHSQGPAGESEGLLVMTWDTKEKAYKAYVLAGDFVGALIETGQFEGDALVYRTELPAGNSTMKLRNVTRLVSPGKIVSEEFMGKETADTLFVHVEATKR